MIDRKRWGLVGCGVVGRRLGERILAGGHSLVVHDRVSSRVDPLVRAGATLASDPRRLAETCDVWITALGTADDVRAVARTAGAWAAARPGTIHIDTTTMAPEEVRTLAAQATDLGARYLEAPLSAGALRPSGPTVTLWVAGPHDDYEAARPLLDVLAETVVYCGGRGQAQVVKITNAAIAQTLTALLGEALTTAVAAGADPTLLRAALRHGTAQNRVLDEQLPRSAFCGDWLPGLRLELATRDLRLAEALARDAGAPTPLLSAAVTRFEEAERRGWGELSAHAVIRLAEEASGVSLTIDEGSRDPRADRPLS